MNTRIISREDWERIERLIAGECSEEDIRTLEHSLRGNPAAQQAMLDYCQLHFDLTFDLRAEAAVKPLVAQVARDRAESSLPGLPDSVADLHSSAAREGSNPLRIVGFAISGWCVAAIAGLVAVMLVLNAPPTREAANPAEQGPDGTPALFTGQSLRLDSGTATLVLPNVGYVVLEGPVDFELISHKRARLKTGRIKMRVTEEAGRGFVVETPDGEITDLGTEFGVDVVDGRETGLVVFEGSVDLRVAESRPTEAARTERLFGGEGALFNKGGPLTRINSIVTGNVATFVRNGEDKPESRAVHRTPIIVKVEDNLRSGDTKKFYEIVTEGLQDDAKAHVDTMQEWNGITSDGVPAYLIGADYVKMFNRDSIQKEYWININLACPAKLYVFLDARSSPPDWLQADFRNTGDRIGLDAQMDKKHRNRSIGKGPGVSVDDEFTIWEREIREPGKVRLGTNLGSFPTPAMYGIAALPLAAADAPPKEASEN